MISENKRTENESYDACENTTGKIDLWDWAILAALLAIGSAIWLWFALSTRIALEDAFITFRYARNLVQGVGFVYNPGERVLGTTTPLQTLLLAFLGRIFGIERIPLLAEFVMPFFGLAAGAFMFFTLRRLGITRLASTTGGLLFFLHPLVIRTSLGGMETPLILFLMALSLYFLTQRRAVAATLTVALLTLCRLDGMIWGGLVIGIALYSKYRRPLQQAMAFTAIWAPWLVFSYLYFGSLLPNTLQAKGVIRPGKEYLLIQPEHFHHLSRWYLSGLGMESNQPFFWVWLAMLILGSYAVYRAKRREALLIAVFPFVYMVVMYLGRAPMYQWYLLPMIFCGTFLVGIGIGQIYTWSINRGSVWRIASVMTSVVLFVPGVMKLAGDLPKGIEHTRLFQENEWGLRRRVGLWLRNNTPEHATVAMEAIGYQGYYSQRRVIDMAGLITPRVVECKRSTGKNGIVFKRIITELKPDFIILRSFEVDDNHHFNGGKLFLTEADRKTFFQDYRELHRFTAPHPELSPAITHLTLYTRKHG